MAMIYERRQSLSLCQVGEISFFFRTIMDCFHFLQFSNLVSLEVDLSFVADANGTLMFICLKSWQITHDWP
jgi:hypothetical protein